jgi:hypothetical protein
MLFRSLLIGLSTASLSFAVTCNLTQSGPVSANYNGQIIENLQITSNGQPAITVDGFSGVIIRNVVIRYKGAHGVKVNNAPDTRIEHVDIENIGAPAAGPLSSSEQNNIQVDNSPRLIVENAKLSRGSAGIYMYGSPNSHLSFIEGYDFRGPFPRGQLAQWNNSNNSILEDFSVVNPQATSWVEDNVNIYGSPGAIVRRGLIDGNNSPSGIGVIFDGGENATGLVQDVDAVRMGNGCFSNYAGGRGNVFERANCRDIICGSQGRPWNDNPSKYGPMSGGLMYTGTGGVGNYGLQIKDSKYYGACGGTVWPAESFTTVDLREENFALRAPIVADVCGTTGTPSSSGTSPSSSSVPPSSSSSLPDLSGRIEAEQFTGQHGIINKGTVIGGLDEGDWARYDNVIFDGQNNAIRVSVAVDPARAGQTISFRLDSLTGTSLSEFVVPNSGGWTTFTTGTALASKVSGKHVLFLVPITGNGFTSGVADVDWFEFYTVAPTSIHGATSKPTVLIWDKQGGALQFKDEIGKWRNALGQSVH